jgi:hypothetical protein
MDVFPIAEPPQMIWLDLLVSGRQTQVPQVKLIRKTVLGLGNAFRFFVFDGLLQAAGYVERGLDIVILRYRREECLLHAGDYPLDNLKGLCVVDSALESHFGFINSILLKYFKLV